MCIRDSPDNIRKYLGKSGKAFLSHVGAKRGSSFLFGTLLSVMMQSSAAASSFAVGLVEVGLLASERDVYKRQFYGYTAEGKTTFFYRKPYIASERFKLLPRITTSN